MEVLTDNISIGIAFFAGVASFFSPCIIPLIPAYISFISGDIEKYCDTNFNSKPFIRTLGFVLGFSIIFIALGASFTFLGSLLSGNLLIFRRISGVLIVFLGLNMLGLINIPILNKEKKFLLSPKPAKNFFYAIFIGMAFSLGWTPCVGPILASILIYAGSSGTLLQGILFLFFYSLGLSLPFIVSSLILGVISRNISKMEKFAVVVKNFSGVLLIVFGLLIFFNKLTEILILLL